MGNELKINIWFICEFAPFYTPLNMDEELKQEQHEEEEVTESKADTKTEENQTELSTRDHQTPPKRKRKKKKSVRKSISRISAVIDEADIRENSRAFRSNNIFQTPMKSPTNTTATELSPQASTTKTLPQTPMQTMKTIVSNVFSNNNMKIFVESMFF